MEEGGKKRLERQMKNLRMMHINFDCGKDFCGYIYIYIYVKTSQIIYFK